MTEHVISVVAEVDEDILKKKEEEEQLKSVVNKPTEDEPVVREQWSKKMDFLMSIIGFSVDLAGIWRL